MTPDPHIETGRAAEVLEIGQSLFDLLSLAAAAPAASGGESPPFPAALAGEVAGEFFARLHEILGLEGGEGD